MLIHRVLNYPRNHTFSHDGKKIRWQASIQQLIQKKPRRFDRRGFGLIKINTDRLEVEQTFEVELVGVAISDIRYVEFSMRVLNIEAELIGDRKEQGKGDTIGVYVHRSSFYVFVSILECESEDGVELIVTQKHDVPNIGSQDIEVVVLEGKGQTAGIVLQPCIEMLDVIIMAGELGVLMSITQSCLQAGNDH